jgi:hypothetical protein
VGKLIMLPSVKLLREEAGWKLKEAAERLSEWDKRKL